MATITLEIGKRNKKKLYPISFLVCQGKSKKRIPTGISATDSELTTNKKKVKELTQARLIETKRRELQDRLDALAIDVIGQEVDAAFICERITATQDDLDMFTFAEDWLRHSNIKGKSNYASMLNTLEKCLGARKLPFSAITFTMLRSIEEYLSDRPRAQSLYLAELRHLYREAIRRYNTDYEQVIKNDPFQRYRVPRQVLKKGVRALSLEDLMKIYNYKGKGRAQLARDCFILSFCLMGMNSVDMYTCPDIKGGVIRYNRTKTAGRRSDGAYIEVIVQPVVEALVNKYKCKAKAKGRAFDFSARYSSPKNFNMHINLGLKTIAKEIGLGDLTFYQARHTFATLSRNLMKFSKSDVDEALNHVGSYDIADVYIKKDFTIINENNARLLERIFGTGT